MNTTDDDLWRAFQTLAMTYPHDDGVRMTADLARWMLAERERLALPHPPVLKEVVQTVSEKLDEPSAPMDQSRAASGR